MVTPLGANSNSPYIWIRMWHIRIVFGSQEHISDTCIEGINNLPHKDDIVHVVMDGA